MEIKKVCRVNYLFYKLSLTEMIVLGVGGCIAFGVWYYIIHQLLIELFYIDFQGTGFIMLVLIPFAGIVVFALNKWIYPKLRLRKVEMDSQTLGFYQAQNEYHISISDIDKVVIFIDVDDMSDDMTIVKKYTIMINKTNYVISLEESKGILMSDEFHQELSISLGLHEREYKVKKVGVVGFNRTYIFK